MTSSVELTEETPEYDDDHRFSVSARRVMTALIVGLVVSLLATAFSYAYFSGQNRQLQTVIDRRVPTTGISIELEDEGLTYICEDPEEDGSFVCARGN